MTVRDLMTKSVITVRAGTLLKEVARLLVDNQISGVVVVDTDGAVEGVVSEADFLVKTQGPDAVRHRRFAGILGESRESQVQLAKLSAITAGGAMTSPAITIGPDRSIADAATQMTARGVNRLPVVEGGRLVGLVTRADLVRAFVRSDDQLAETIRNDVLLRILWLDPTLYEVTVVDGIAIIRGEVERRSTAEMIGRIVAMVPGVVDVVTDVRWRRDDRNIEPATVDPVFPFSPR